MPAFGGRSLNSLTAADFGISLSDPSNFRESASKRLASKPLVLAQSDPSAEPPLGDGGGIDLMADFTEARFWGYAIAGAARVANTLGEGASQMPVYGGLATGFGVALVDYGLDESIFKNTPRHMPSILADMAAPAILWTPQPVALKMAEMVGLHILGRLADKAV
jgi:hypothetical protein